MLNHILYIVVSIENKLKITRLVLMQIKIVKVMIMMMILIKILLKKIDRILI